MSKSSARATPAKPVPQADDKHYHGHRKRLRTRFRDNGDTALADYEILELLLFRLQVEASRWKDVLQTFGLLEKRKDLSREERQSLLVPVVTALLKVGERGRAEKYLQEALRGPSDKRDWVLFQLGSLFVERGEKEKGRDYWNRLSREFPESFWSRQARLALESGL